MIAPEKLRWINQHLRRGDKRAIEQRTKAPYSAVVDVLRGRYYSLHGRKIVAAAERIIKTRQQRLKVEKKRYSRLK